MSCEEGSNPGTGAESYKAHLEIVGIAEGGSCEQLHVSHKVGDRVIVVERISGKGASSGLGRVKAFVMAAAGFDDEGAFDEYDPHGDFIDSTTGLANAYSARGDTIVGRLVDSLVTRGNPCKDKDGSLTGDYYRVFAWSPVADEDQDQAGDGGA